MICMLSVFTACCSAPSPPPDKEIYGAVTLTDQWLEINLKEPIKPEREITEVVIRFADETNYIVVLKEEKLRLPDGSPVFLEGQIFDKDGAAYELKLAGYNHSLVLLGSRDANHNSNMPKDKFYTKVRLKSTKPLKCRQIAWRNYNPWDRK
jgi:hypothetical protein